MAKNVYNDTEYVPYKPLKMKNIDPLKSLPPIVVNGKEFRTEDEDYLARTFGKVKETSTKKDDVDPDIVVEKVTNEPGNDPSFTKITKRKSRSPEKEKAHKRKKANTPEKVCRRVAEILRGTMHPDEESDDESDTDDENGIETNLVDDAKEPNNKPEEGKKHEEKEETKNRETDGATAIISS